MCSDCVERAAARLGWARTIGGSTRVATAGPRRPSGGRNDQIFPLRTGVGFGHAEPFDQRRSPVLFTARQRRQARSLAGLGGQLDDWLRRSHAAQALAAAQAQNAAFHPDGSRRKLDEVARIGLAVLDVIKL